jgi:peptidoglycan/xylan/chitin deacetylase (PgdA/CDA1 family)
LKKNKIFESRFIISLDFELDWGLHHNQNIDAKYKDKILRTRKVIPKILRAFEKYHINATWAIVGALFAKNKAELYNYSPKSLFRYTNSKFNSQNIKPGYNENDDPLHYAPSLIKLIREVKGQEIATHTYFHHYALESGPSLEDFEDDIKSAISIAQSQGIQIQSIVFPMNQVNRKYLKILAANGITAFRGNQSHSSYISNGYDDDNESFKRIFRLLDSYLPLYRIDGSSMKIKETSGKSVLDIPATAFLRPFNIKLKWLEPFRFHRLSTSMTRVAKNGGVFHLWWHPHNFSDNELENLYFLDKILKHYRYLNELYGMESVSMRDLSREV